LKNPVALEVLVWSRGRLVTREKERKKNYASSKKLLASIKACHPLVYNFTRFDLQPGSLIFLGCW